MTLSRFFCLPVMVLAYACPLAAQTPTSAPLPSFEVATVRADPGGDPDQGSWSRPGMGMFKADHVSLELLIHLAYDVDRKQIVNEPRWLATRLYDINARPESGVTLKRDELRPRLEDLLRQRFHLACHREMREEVGYAIVAAKRGPKLTPTHGAPFAGFRRNVNPGHLEGLNWSMIDLAKNIASLIARPVADRTGIEGGYDFSIRYAPDNATDSTLPSLFTALEESCGLRLEAAKIPVEVLVIDSVDEEPTAN